MRAEMNEHAAKSSNMDASAGLPPTPRNCLRAGSRLNELIAQNLKQKK